MGKRQKISKLALLSGLSWVFSISFLSPFSWAAYDLTDEIPLSALYEIDRDQPINTWNCLQEPLYQTKEGVLTEINEWGSHRGAQADHRIIADYFLKDKPPLYAQMIPFCDSHGTLLSVVRLDSIQSALSDAGLDKESLAAFFDDSNAIYLDLLLAKPPKDGKGFGGGSAAIHFLSNLVKNLEKKYLFLLSQKDAMGFYTKLKFTSMFSQKITLKPYFYLRLDSFNEQKKN